MEWNGGLGCPVAGCESWQLRLGEQSLPCGESASTSPWGYGGWAGPRKLDSY